MKWSVVGRSFILQPSGLRAPVVAVLSSWLLGLLFLSGCGGGGSGDTNPVLVVAPFDFEVNVVDVLGAPIRGAAVTMSAEGAEQQVPTNAEGVAAFRILRPGMAAISVTAAGFESLDSGPVSLDGQTSSWHVTLVATEAWAIGQPIVLGSRMLERAGDGSALAFSVDLAVIDQYAEGWETLSGVDFSVVTIDCGWGGSRDCASDAAGNETHRFSADGPALDFELLVPSPRRAYLVEVLAERSTNIDWERRIPALKSFFAALGGNDLVSLSTVHSQPDGSAARTVLGDFASDGSTYFDAIDRLARPAGAPPLMLESLLAAIQRVASADGFGIADVDRYVLVLSRSWLEVPEFEAAAELARRLGVRVSVIGAYNYGITEVAVRSGGFSGEVDYDERQYGLIFGAMDRLLAGVTPYYRMQFRIQGPPGTFVSGGNVKVHLNIRVPTPLPTNGLWATVDVAIP